VAAHLAARLGFYAAYAPASCRLFPSQRLQTWVARAMNFTEGPAIVSRFPFWAVDIHELPRGGRIMGTASAPRRDPAHAVGTTPGGVYPYLWSGRPARAIATHLRSQSRALPLLLMGDFKRGGRF